MYTNADLKISLNRRFHITTPFTFWDIRTKTWNIYKHSETTECVKKLAYFLRNYKVQAQITREFLGLRMLNFQFVVFIWWTRTYREIFKSALAYLSPNLNELIYFYSSFLGEQKLIFCLNPLNIRSEIWRWSLKKYLKEKCS